MVQVLPLRRHFTTISIRTSKHVWSHIDEIIARELQERWREALMLLIRQARDLLYFLDLLWPHPRIHLHLTKTKCHVEQPRGDAYLCSFPTATVSEK